MLPYIIMDLPIFGEGEPKGGGNSVKLIQKYSFLQFY